MLILLLGIDPLFRNSTGTLEASKSTHDHIDSGPLEVEVEAQRNKAGIGDFSLV